MIFKEPDIYLKESFIENPNSLFSSLRSEVIWDARMKARKTASFGTSYNYSGITYPKSEMLETLVSVCKSIEKELNFHPNNCLLNFYPNGRSSMGFHSDSSEELAKGTGVATISLGAERTITYKSKINKNLRINYLLKNGALLFMSNDVQKEWLHAILKQENVGERISLTFRKIIK